MKGVFRFCGADLPDLKVLHFLVNCTSWLDRVCYRRPIYWPAPSHSQRHNDISGSSSATIDNCGAFSLLCSRAKMIPRAGLARNGQRALQWQMRSNNRRGLATAASGSFSYGIGDAGGVKFASRDLPGPTTHLALVAKAGTRYQPLPGFSEGLEKFSFKVRFSLH